MNRYSNNSLGGMIVKGVLILVAIVIGVWLLQKVFAVLASLLFLAFIVVAVLAAFRYFGRRRY